ncbi:hypothetical protein N431DRAFT_470223 [Stipitochalara longipes BDJ]|nr:hypothetical protein N431DRAFT_470223 [Stipitochalara longipes BDJ]
MAFEWQNLTSASDTTFNYTNAKMVFCNVCFEMGGYFDEIFGECLRFAHPSITDLLQLLNCGGITTGSLELPNLPKEGSILVQVCKWPKDDSFNDNVLALLLELTTLKGEYRQRGLTRKQRLGG